MKRFYCDCCGEEMACPVTKAFINLKQGKLYIPHQFPTDDGFKADVCYECLYQALGDFRLGVGY